MTNQALTASALEAQAHELHTQLRQTGINRCTLLFDSAVYKPLRDPHFIHLLEQCNAQSMLMNLPLLEPDNTPWLIELNLDEAAHLPLLHYALMPQQANTFDPLLPAEQPLRLCAIAQSQQSLGTQARTMGGVALQPLPGQSSNNPKRMLLRYYDPTVFPYLWLLLTDTQRHTLLYDIPYWWIPTRNGQWRPYIRPAADSTLETWSLQLSQKQWKSVDDISLLNLVQSICLETGYAAHHSTDTAAQLTLKALTRAEQNGFYRQEDKIQYALRSLHTHPLFDTHPKIAQRLQERNQRNQLKNIYSQASVLALQMHSQTDNLISFRALFDDLEEADWQNMAQTLPAYDTPPTSLPPDMPIVPLPFTRLTGA